MVAPSSGRVEPRDEPASQSERFGAHHLAPRRGGRGDRLRGRREFESVLTRDVGVRGRYFVLRSAPNAAAIARLGVIASRKAMPRAIDRNTCKRIVREAFRARAADLAGLDVVVVCRIPVAGKARILARRELDRLLPQLVRGNTPARGPDPSALRR